MKEFTGKKVFISPYSPITKNLRLFLEENGITVLGFIDKNISAEGVFKVEEMADKKYDAIFIYSPNHFQSIYNTYKKSLHVSKLYQVEKTAEGYAVYDRKQILLKTLQRSFLNLNTKLKKLFLKHLSAFLDRVKYKRTKNVFIGEGYVDANIKHLYLHYVKNAQNAILLSDNEEQLKVLKEHHLPSARLGSWLSHFYIALAKNIFLDHILYNYLDCLSPSQKTLQLWHGVGLKRINDMSNIEYDYFVSTSEWTNETNFQNVFKAKEFLNLGYPRLDIFFKDEEKDDLIFCDMGIYDLVKNAQGKKILYMPTYRENEMHNTPPLDFELLNEQMKEMDAYFIVKFHPFVKIQKPKALDRIIFYETQSDIYPILKYVDVLVSDYSSVIYDFLLLDRPVISFIYDYEDYMSHRDGFLFDYFEYSPSCFVKTQNELIGALQGSDEMYEKRAHVKNFFFDTAHKPACKAIQERVS
ncbi:CDP-glycerol glycerophosphotransferase family protein [bacterium]|nr:CDP-glycerol glycerophosphotransferase family protein [bacterium]